MSNRKLILITTCLLWSCLQGIAQNKFAEQKMDRLAYEGAIKQYEASLASDSTNMEDWSNLAECYRMTRRSIQAEHAYYKVIYEGAPTAEHHFHYTLSLMENEKYDAAARAADDFLKAYPSDSRAINVKKGIEKHAELLATEAFYKVEKVTLNSDQNDMCPIPYAEGLVFASNRGEAGTFTNVHAWTGQKFMSLYYAQGAEMNFSFAAPFAEEIGSKFNDGPACFSADGSTMYFTRNSVEDKKATAQENFKIKLKLFYSIKNGETWSAPQPFAFNSDEYNTAHPALSKDGSALYFASDRPGGQGGMDIWKCEWDGSSWTNPINLGEKINTPGNEIFPYHAPNGDFYFSSNGHYGLGGLDLLVVEGAGDPINLGSPMNSSDDDFGICITAEGNTGYFTSNRKAQQLNDDIYYFKKQCADMKLKIVDSSSGEVLIEAEVTVVENGIEKSTEITDSTGYIQLCLNPLHDYEFKAKKKNYGDSVSKLSAAQIAAASIGGSDVTVELTKNASKEITLTGRVFNQDDKSGVAGQEVVLVNELSQEKLTTQTDAQGRYSFLLAADQRYEVSSVKKGCGDVKEPFSTGYVTEAKLINIDLPILCVGDVVQIDNIYYDYNKSNIRSDAALELDKVVAMMNKYPALQIELRSHTDARGKDSYNMTLSDARAKSARQYIVDKGIAPERLIAKGYGETELKNNCGNDAKCSDDQHAVNRRTEFKVLKM